MKTIDRDLLIRKYIDTDIAKFNNSDVKIVLENLKQNILKMPIIEKPNREWIPCSERLPNYREAVLVSTFWGVRMAERDSVKEDGTDDFWYLFLDDATACPMYVYAWMPLPETWKGADDE